MPAFTTAHPDSVASFDDFFADPALKAAALPDVLKDITSGRHGDGQAIDLGAHRQAGDPRFERRLRRRDGNGRERWSGDRPLEGAYFYYDAVGLVALALEKTPLVDGKFPVKALETAIASVAGPPGEAVGWNELQTGIRRIHDGEPIYYSGLTGPMLLQSCGDRRLGVSSTWTVHAGTIVDVPDQ